MQCLWENICSALQEKPFFKVLGLPWNYDSSNVAFASCTHCSHFLQQITANCLEIIIPAMVEFYVYDYVYIHVKLNFKENENICIRSIFDCDLSAICYFRWSSDCAEFHCQSDLVSLIQPFRFSRTNFWDFSEPFWRDDFDWYSITSLKSTLVAMFSL